MLIEEESGNVYADIGGCDPEGMLRKAGLAVRIGSVMQSKKLDLSCAASAAGINELCLSQWLMGQFRDANEGTLQACLTKLEKWVV